MSLDLLNRFGLMATSSSYRGPGQAGLEGGGVKSKVPDGGIGRRMLADLSITMLSTPVVMVSRCDSSSDASLTQDAAAIFAAVVGGSI